MTTKKSNREEAFRIFLESEGSISNKELAEQLGVAVSTINKWKVSDGWVDKLQEDDDFDPDDESDFIFADLDMLDLLSPNHIIEINRRINELLKKEELSSSEIADLAQAKTNLLQGMEIIMNMARDMAEPPF